MIVSESAGWRGASRQGEPGELVRDRGPRDEDDELEMMVRGWRQCRGARIDDQILEITMVSLRGLRGARSANREATGPQGCARAMYDKGKSEGEGGLEPAMRTPEAGGEGSKPCGEGEGWQSCEAGWLADRWRVRSEECGARVLRKMAESAGASCLLEGMGSVGASAPSEEGQGPLPRVWVDLGLGGVVILQARSTGLGKPQQAG